MALKFNSGLTLVELLIVVLITSILMFIGIASFNSFNDKQGARQAAQDFVTQLRVVQKMASAAQYSISCTAANNVIVSYRVQYESATQYSITLICTSGPSVIMETKTLTNKSIFKISFASIDFLPMGKGIIGSGPIIKVGNCEVPINLGGGGTMTVGDVTGC